MDKILIYNSGGGLGDSIQLFPLIISLKNHFKKSKFYYLGAHENHFNGKLKEYNIKYPTHNVLWLCERKDVLNQQFNKEIINERNFNEIINKLIARIIEDPAASPSKPSNQLKAFTRPTIHKILIKKER